MQSQIGSKNMSLNYINISFPYCVLHASHCLPLRIWFLDQSCDISWFILSFFITVLLINVLQIPYGEITYWSPLRLKWPNEASKDKEELCVSYKQKNQTFLMSSWVFQILLSLNLLYPCENNTSVTQFWLFPRVWQLPNSTFVGCT